MLTCEQVDLLEIDVASRILSAGDQQDVERHLAQCDRHPRIAEYRAALLALDLGVEPLEPPPGLRRRVLASAARGKGHRFRSPPWYVAAAASLVLVIAAAAIVLVLRGGDGDGISRSFQAEGGIDVRVEASYAEPGATVSFAHLAALPDDQEYTVWAIRDTEWLFMGSFRPGESGAWSGTFAFQLQPGDALCLTAGAGSPDWPHGKPLFIQPL